MSQTHPPTPLNFLSHSQANLQSTAIQELNYSVNDAYRRLRKLQVSSELWHERAEDLPKLADVVWNAGDRVAALERDARPRMAAARDVGLRCRLVLEVNLCSVKAVDLPDLCEVARVTAVRFAFLLVLLRLVFVDVPFLGHCWTEVSRKVSRDHTKP